MKTLIKGLLFVALVVAAISLAARAFSGSSVDPFSKVGGVMSPAKK